MYQIPLHSILYIIGPAISAKQQLIKKIQKELNNITVEFTSSLEKVKALSTFPSQSQIIIFDKPNPYESINNELRAIAKENNFNLVPIALEPNTPSQASKKQLRIYKHNTLSHINKKNYKSFIKLETQDFNTISFEVSNFLEWKRTQINTDTEYLIVGDVHGCFDTLLSLLEKANFKIKNNIITNANERKIILAGDLIDKGPKTKDVLEFVLKNKSCIYVVRGNHEQWVYKKLNNQKQESIPFEVQKSYFTDSIKYKDDEGYKKLLNQVIEISFPFIETNNFIVTHAPCPNKYLGKISTVSLNNQRNQNQPLKSEAKDNNEHISNVKNKHQHLWKEANTNHKKHIFGHWAMQEVFSYKNKLGIDTGAVKGHKLSAVLVKNNVFTIISVPTKEDIEYKQMFDYNTSF